MEANVLQKLGPGISGLALPLLATSKAQRIINYQLFTKKQSPTKRQGFCFHFSQPLFFVAAAK
jgi:hypothetical protein